MAMTTAKQILIIDDHPLVHTCLKALFAERQDMKVCDIATDCSIARQKLQEYQPDLAILDLALKDGSGLKLLQQFAKKSYASGKKIRFLVLSALDEALLGPRVLAAGSRGYISKQAPLERVCDAAEAILSGGSWFSADSGVLVAASEHKPCRDGIESLSNRELEIFDAIGLGLSTKEIADQAGISAKTVESHKDNIKAKLGLESSTALLRHAVQWSLESLYPSGPDA